MTDIVQRLTAWWGQLTAWFRPADTWHYTGGKRDLRLDFLRGFAVVAMVVDHIGGHRSWLYVITGGDSFFISAAEVFVCISGLLMGCIYGEIIARQGLGTALVKCLQRGWHLYLLTVTLTLLYAALSQYWNLRGIAVPWSEFLVSVVTLHRTFPFTDILLMYTLLVWAAVPVFVLLSHGHTLAVLAASWGLWALWHLAPQHAQFPWPVAENNVFQFSAWQVLFFSALVLGYHRRRIEQYVTRLSPSVVLGISGAGLASAIAIYAWNLAPQWIDNAALLYQPWSKPDLGPGRLLVFACFMSFALTLLTVAWVPMSRALNWLLLPLGQHALTAYTLHLWVVACLTQVRPWVAAMPLSYTAQNTLLQTVGVLIIWTMIRLQPLLVQRWRQHWCRRGGTVAAPAVKHIAPAREAVAA